MQKENDINKDIYEIINDSIKSMPTNVPKDGVILKPLEHIYGYDVTKHSIIKIKVDRDVKKENKNERI